MTITRLGLDSNRYKMVDKENEFPLSMVLPGRWGESEEVLRYNRVGWLKGLLLCSYIRKCHLFLYQDHALRYKLYSDIALLY